MEPTTPDVSATNPRTEHLATVPYITAWSTELVVLSSLTAQPGIGISYRDEALADRDSQGVLWARTTFNPQAGEPDFGRVHPLRQRRAMRRLLCQVCGAPADQTEHGVLWLLKDHRGDWDNWPEGMGVTEPPVCQSCVRVASRLCPALRRGAVTVRAREHPLVGVHGELCLNSGQHPVMAGRAILAFTDPTNRWLLATSLVRELRQCSITSLEDT